MRRKWESILMISKIHHLKINSINNKHLVKNKHHQAERDSQKHFPSMGCTIVKHFMNCQLTRRISDTNHHNMNTWLMSLIKSKNDRILLLFTDGNFFHQQKIMQCFDF